VTGRPQLRRPGVVLTQTGRPAAGATAAGAAALAASLVAMVAERSRGSWAESGGALAQASTLEARSLELARANADAYAGAAAALERRTEIEAPLRATVEALLGLGDVAADVADLAALAAAHCDPKLQPDAEAAALIAEAAVGVAEVLIRANLTVGPDDGRVARIARLRVEAGRSVLRAAEAR
jgi:formiminotetrahydrofolate cyclodeaminase